MTVCVTVKIFRLDFRGAASVPTCSSAAGPTHNLFNNLKFTTLELAGLGGFSK